MKERDRAILWKHLYCRLTHIDWLLARLPARAPLQSFAKNDTVGTSTTTS